MSDLKNLREQFANIATEARSKLSEIATDTTEERAAEIEREFDAMMADADKIEARIAREEKAEALQAKLAEPDTSKIPAPEGRQTQAVDAGFQKDYRTAFAEYISKGGEASLDAETRSLLVEKRVQTVGTNTAGGFTVPTEMATFIEQSMAASGPMYTSDLFSVIQTADGRQFDIPTIDDTAKVAAAHTEGADPTNDGGVDAVFGSKSVGAFAFNSEFIRWSAELNADSILNMESLLGQLVGERLGRIANSKLTTGSGSSDVEGIVTNSAAGKTAASATAIAADEIIDLIHSVDPAYRSAPSTAIMMNDSTLAAIRKLKDGNGNYLWQMGNYQAGVPQNILGYNVVVNQAMDSIATAKKTILFGDMKKFYVRKAGGISIQVLTERMAPDLAILGFLRVDGVLSNTAAIKHLVQA
jgi:HK97 family phage major capsid protein